MSIINPCKGCKDRYLGCHGKCDKYKEFKQNIADANDERMKQNSIKSYQVEKAYAIKKKNKLNK